jgi:hypothetical protein
LTSLTLGCAGRLIEKQCNDLGGAKGRRALEILCLRRRLRVKAIDPGYLRPTKNVIRFTSFWLCGPEEGAAKGHGR